MQVVRCDPHLRKPGRDNRCILWVTTLPWSYIANPVVETSFEFRAEPDHDQRGTVGFVARNAGKDGFDWRQGCAVCRTPLPVIR